MSDLRAASPADSPDAGSDSGRAAHRASGVAAIRLAQFSLTRPARGREPRFTLGPLDLELAAGTTTAIVGPSGSGKTTLLRCIAGLESATAGTTLSGTVEIGGRPEAAPGSLGFVFQSAALWPHLTARAHLRFAAPGLSRKGADALLDRVGLGHARKRRPASLSGGEAQRLGLARALAGNPTVLLLDEPLASVDVHRRQELARLIRDVVRERGITAVLVTHDRDEALAIANDLVVIADGRLVEQGEAKALATAPTHAFTASFLGGAQCLPATQATVDPATGRAVFDTPLGRVQPMNEIPAGAASLVVFAGELALSTSKPDVGSAREGTVVHLQPSPLDPASSVLVEVALAGGEIVTVLHATQRSSAALSTGDGVWVSMQGMPRVLSGSPGASNSMSPSNPS